MAKSAAIGNMFVNLGINSAEFTAGLKAAQTSLASFSKTMAVGLAAAAASVGAGFTAALANTRAALEKFGAIADQAKAAGLDPEFFQGFAYQARLAGVDTNALAGALNTFAKNAGLAAESKGKLVGQLQALSPELLRNIQLATDQQGRILAVADAIAQETDASQKAAIATAAFGDQGVKLVAVLEQGAAAIQKTIDKAREMGLIVSRDLIARADELGDKFDTAAEIVDLKLKQSFINLAPVLLQAANLAADFSGYVAIIADQFNAIENRQYLRPLQNELAATYNEMQPIKDRIAEIDAALAGGAPNGMILKLDLTDAQGKLDVLTAKANQLLSRIQQLQGWKPAATGATAPAAPPNNNLIGDAGLSLLDLPKIDVPGMTSSLDAMTKSVGAATASLQPLDLGINQVATSTKSLSTEIGDTLADAFSSFAEGVLGGENALKSLSDVLGNIGKQLLNGAISTFFSNLFGGGFGGLFGGGAASVRMPSLYAAGGISNGPAIFGESGPEAAVPLPDGRTIPVTLTGGGGYLDVRVVNEVRNGNMIPVMTQVAGEVAGRKIKAEAPAAVAAAQRNRGMGG